MSFTGESIDSPVDHISKSGIDRFNLKSSMSGMGPDWELGWLDTVDWFAYRPKQ